MTPDAEQIQNELPAGWKLLGIRSNGLVEVESDALNVVIRATWAACKPMMTSLMLSHRVR